MFGKETKELLVNMNGAQIKMQTDMQWIKEKLREADSEVGYKRCVQHKAAVDTLEVDVGKVEKSFKWIRNTVVGGLISLVVVGCGAAMNYVFGV